MVAPEGNVIVPVTLTSALAASLDRGRASACDSEANVSVQTEPSPSAPVKVWPVATAGFDEPELLEPPPQPEPKASAAARLSVMMLLILVDPSGGNPFGADAPAISYLAARPAKVPPSRDASRAADSSSGGA